MTPKVPLLVVAALRAEVAPLLRRLGGDPEIAARGVARVVLGTLRGVRVAVAWTGDGARCAGEGLRALLDALAVDRLLVVGVAGGLSPGLEPAALVIAERVVDGDAGAVEVPAPCGSWGAGLERVAQTAPSGGARTGTVLSAPRIAVSRDDKAALWHGIGRPPVAVVDLETATFARLAAERAIPYAALRAVSDPADETLPVDFNELRDRRGRVSRASVARWAVAHPRAMPRLLGLGRRVRSCAERLAEVSEALWAREAPACRG